MNMHNEGLSFEGLLPSVSGAIEPFINDVMERYEKSLHSIHLVGSALTPDYDEKRSDINTVFLLQDMDLKFVELIAPLGKKYKKKGVAAPLIMTPPYIRSSLDVFPVEFHDMKLIHKTLYGEDLLAGLEVDRKYLRLQCEREIKSKLIWLRQGYISSLGDRRLLTERLSASINGYIPLFRAIVFLLDSAPPLKRHDVITLLQEKTGIETGVFEKVLLLRRQAIRLHGDELKRLFEEYYLGTERINKIIDELPV